MQAQRLEIFVLYKVNQIIEQNVTLYIRENKKFAQLFWSLAIITLCYAGNRTRSTTFFRKESCTHQRNYKCRCFATVVAQHNSLIPEFMLSFLDFVR